MTRDAAARPEDPERLVRREVLEREGWVVVPDLLSEAELDRYTALLEPVLAANGRGRTDFEGRATERVYALLAKCPEIAALAEHPAIVDLCDPLMATDYLLSSVQAIRIHEGQAAQPLHCDDDPGVLERPRPLHGYSVMWALTDFNEANGATRLVPGSHRKATAGPPDATKAISARMRAGSALVYLGGIEHGGGAHTGGPARLGVSVIYCQPWLRQFENLMMATPPEIARALPERTRRMLGYRALHGIWGTIDGRDPMRALDPRT
ncbi:MAG: phytanoyl-CoA dioxygenase family protein [Myxococcota bacterium]